MTASLPPSARPTADGASPTITWTASGLLAVLPLSTDIYLTAMVDLGRDFGADVAGVQRTMLAFTLGFGLAHLVIGRLADRFGRRPVALVGIAVYVAGSILAVAAPGLGWLVAARLIQGAAAACGPIIARTLVRDTVPPELAGHALSKIGAILAIAPLAAPVLGTLIAGWGGWRAALALLVVYGIGLGLVLARVLPETRPPHLADAADVSIFRALARLCRRRIFVVGALALACGYGVLFAWLTTSAFLLVGTLGIAKFDASLIYTLGAGGYLAGGLLAMRLAHRTTPRRILKLAAGLIVVGTLLPIAVLLGGLHHWLAFLIALLPFYLGWGLAQPMATATAMRPFPEIAGQASAWLGMAQQAGGIGFAMLASAFGGGLATLVVMVLAALAFTATVFVAAAADRPAV